MDPTSGASDDRQVLTVAEEQSLPTAQAPIHKSPKVLLIRPPQQFNYGVWPRGPRLSIPTGLLAIGSYLKHSDVDVSIFDAFVEGDDFYGNSFTRKHYYKRSRARSWVTESFRHQESGSLPAGQETHDEPSFVHFGASWDQIAQAIAADEPNIVGITNIFRENTFEVLRVARLVKQVAPQATVIVGGPNANAQPESLMRDCDAIDLVGLFDGEQVMLDLVRQVQESSPLSAVPNIVYRDADGQPVRTKTRAAPMDLDQYGALDYDLIRLERYFAYERGGIMARNKFLYPGADRAVSMVTSRGCPYKCSFCSIHVHAGKKFRGHSLDYLISQIEDLVVRRGIKHIHFEDDNLALDLRRFVGLLTAILERQLVFTWDTPNGIFAENLTEEVLALMKATGCVYAIVGVESGDQWVLDNVIGKQPLKLTTVSKVFESANRVGLDLHAFYVIGFPRETMPQIERTLSFASTALTQNDVVPHLSLARADPGTALYNEAVRTGTLVADVSISNVQGVRSDMFTRHLIATDEFDPAKLESLNEEFHGSCIKHILRDRVRFLAGRPIDALAVTAELIRNVTVDHMTWRQAAIKLFWCRLLYKNAIKRYGTQARWVAAFARAGKPIKARF